MTKDFTTVILVQVCTVCDRTLELTDKNFKKSRKTKSGFTYNCRRCPGGRCCAEFGCIKPKPRYGVNKHGILYCSIHGKDKGYKDIKSACICGRTERRFGFEGGKRSCCTTCRKPGMIDLKTPRCFCGKSKPTFGLINRKPTHCRKCKDNSMIDVMHKKCIVCKNIIPSYGLIRGHATHCANCKVDGLIDVVNPGCKCGKVSKPHYGYRDSIAECCTECKEDGMIYKYQRLCRDCKKKTARFSYEKELPSHCTSCRKSGMILTTHKTNICKKCRQKPAVFSASDYYRVPVYCASCSVTNSQRIKGNLCTHKNCSKLATFGFPGVKAINCAVHRQDGTIYCPRRKCMVQNCHDFAIFGIGKPLRCEIHKEPEDIDLIQRRCQSCDLISIVTDSGLCSYCDPNNNRPTYMHRQRIISSLICSTELPAEMIGEDCIVSEKSCAARERPDFVWDCGTHYIILEVDENQHKSYPVECEIIRMINIAQSIGGPPIVFIRYNPDSYRTKQMVYNTMQSFRHKILIKNLRREIERIPRNFVEAVYLFYDGWSGTPRREIVQKYE